MFIKDKGVIVARPYSCGVRAFPEVEDFDLEPGVVEERVEGEGHPSERPVLCKNDHPGLRFRINDNKTMAR